MIHRSRKHLSPAARRTAILLALFALLPTGSALAFFGGFSGIVFDPSNFAENLRQAAALLEQIDRAATQIRLQRRMLAALPTSVPNGLRQAANGLRQQLGASPSELGVGHAGDWSPLDSLYPISHAGFLPTWLDTMRPPLDAGRTHHGHP